MKIKSYQMMAKLSALKRVSQYTRFKTRKAVALSTLFFCENYLKNALQIVQKKAARAVTKSGKRTPIRTLLKECGWLSVAQLGVFHSLVLVYKILERKSPQYLYDQLSGTQEETHYNTRFTKKQSASQAIKLGPDAVASGDLARSSFKYRASSQWNDLPLNIRQAKTLKHFKVKLRKWILENVSIK